MRAVNVTAGLALGVLTIWAQDAPKPVQAGEQPAAQPVEVIRTVDVSKLIEDPSEHVVATVDGAPITAKEIQDWLRTASPAIQSNFKRSPEGFFRQYAMLIHFEKLAEKSGFDKTFPYKQQLEMQRRYFLFNAQIQQFMTKVQVTDEQKQEYFTKNKADYLKGTFKVIYLAFHPSAGDTAAKGTDQAKATADKVMEEVRGGADFVTLVKKYSEDEESKSKDGEFGPFTANDPSVPEAIRTAIFKLKPGEVSEPLGHENGFFIVKAVKFDQPDFETLRGQLGDPIRRQKTDEWVRSQQNDTQLEIKDKAFFAPEVEPEAK
jgi:peptidyl-prolyl cis-trans isomerase C